MHETGKSHKILVTSETWAKEGEDFVCTETKKYYFKKEAIDNIKTQLQEKKKALQSLNTTASITEVDSELSKLNL